LFVNAGFILDVVMDTLVTSLFMRCMYRKSQALAFTRCVKSAYATLGRRYLTINRSTKMMVTKLVYYAMIAGVLTT
jgi:hypothetical protein